MLCTFWQGVITCLQTLAPTVWNWSFACNALMVFHWGTIGVQEDKADAICREEWTINPLVKLPQGGGRRGGLNVAHGGRCCSGNTGWTTCPCKRRRAEICLWKMRHKDKFWLSFCFLIPKILWRCWGDFLFGLTSSTVFNFTLSSLNCPGTRSDDAVICFSLLFSMGSGKRRLCSWDSCAW